ncbi:endonuclease domain-containing protein [Amycolatopsis sp. NPDC004079]|uniref:endonuclease domain-containing protein n=1 Tax=Amycolatopsis sp. NPDC004079 TaxID=3154549 RepID=UPI00339FB5C2
MTSLDDFPPFRREDLVLRYFVWHGMDRDDVEKMVQLSADIPCRLPHRFPTVKPAWSSATPVGKIRSRLLEAFGPMCAICVVNEAAVVDHDHETGLCRGLLCYSCNKWVDLCPHPCRCPYADYLTDPPARLLGIRYPNRGRKPRLSREDAARHMARADSPSTNPHT